MIIRRKYYKGLHMTVVIAKVKLIIIQSKEVYADGHAASSILHHPCLCAGHLTILDNSYQSPST